MRAAKSFAVAFSRPIGLSSPPKIEIFVCRSLGGTSLPESDGWRRFENPKKGLIIDIRQESEGGSRVRAFVGRDFLHPETGRRAQRETVLETISSMDVDGLFRPGSRGKVKKKEAAMRAIKVLFLDSPFSGAKGHMKVNSASLFLGTALKERGIGVEICPMDLSAIEEGDPQEAVIQEEILRRELAKGYDIVAFGFSADIGIRHIDRLTTMIRENSDGLIAVGGPLPTLLPEHVIAHLDRIDILIRGEAEEAFPRVLWS